MVEHYMDEAWRQSMRIRLDYNNMMSSSLGNKGIYRREFESIQSQIGSAVKVMDLNRTKMPWRELPYNQLDIIQDIQNTVKEIRDEFDSFVVLGIGGCLKGAEAVHSALNHLHYNELPREKRSGPKMYFEDSIDPEKISALLDILDIQKTAFNIISDSKNLLGTLSYLLIITALLHQKLGSDISNHLYITTEDTDSPIFKIAQKENLKVFIIPHGIGGCFSVLSPAGLLSAAVSGIDLHELLSGAAFMERVCSNGRDLFANPAYMLGILQYIAMEHGCNCSIIMPYADSLQCFSEWYAYLWANTLSKKFDRTGRIVRTGQTPVRAKGISDQYPMLPLFTEGPFDKVITFLSVDHFRSETVIEDGYFEDPEISYLCGHSLNELMDAEKSASEYMIAKSGHLNHTIRIPFINAFTIGELIMLFEMTATFAGELLNIDSCVQECIFEERTIACDFLDESDLDKKQYKSGDYRIKDPQQVI